MIIADIDYLQPISETSAIHLIGGYRRASRRSALAMADFLAIAFSPSTFTTTVVDNQAVTDADGFSFASSSVNIASTAPGENGVALASATAFAAVVPTTKTTVLPILENPSEE